MYAYIYYRVGDQHTAEDLAADVFVRALAGIARYAWRGTPLLAWLYRIAHNVTADYRKSAARRAAHHTAADPLDVEDTRDHLLELDEQSDMMRAIRSLTEDQQQVIILRFYGGLSNAEVGQVIDKPEGAVKALQSRGLRVAAANRHRRATVGMTEYRSFDDALDAAIDAIREGQPLAAVLAQHPRHAAAMRPLLEAAARLEAAAPLLAPASPRLAEKFTVVQAALRDARRDASADEREAPRWWQRRLTFASMSLPAFAAGAIALAGAGGAAAATVAVVGPAAVRDAADAVTPHWVHNIVTPASDDGPAHATASPTSGATGGAAAPADATAQAGATAHASAPAGQSGTNGTALDVSGIASDLNGNTFTLTASGHSWHVIRERKHGRHGDDRRGSARDRDRHRHRRRQPARGQHRRRCRSGRDDDSRRARGRDPAASATPTPAGDTQPDKTPPGQSGSPPGQDKTPPGNSGSPPGQSGDPPPGQGGTPPGNGNGNGSGNGNGRPATPTPDPAAPSNSGNGKGNGPKS